MKTRILTLLSVVALALTLSFSASTVAAPKPAAAPERHPEIRAAIGALERAKGHLQEAAHDFGGHRVEAIKATDEALRQLNLCLKFDKE